MELKMKPQHLQTLHWLKAIKHGVYLASFYSLLTSENLSASVFFSQGENHHSYVEYWKPHIWPRAKLPRLFLWNGLPSILQFYTNYSWAGFKASEVVSAMCKLCMYKHWASASLHLWWWLMVPAPCRPLETLSLERCLSLKQLWTLPQLLSGLWQARRRRQAEKFSM